ncbi:MAG: prolyl oligopeptidase family serine peptidase [Pyrinomonadaceae bacterium]
MLLTLTVSTLGQTTPPKAERREVKDIYFGQTIRDSYRWLENLKSDETQKWIKAQADYSRVYLDKLPMRGEILTELTALSDAGTSVRWIQQRGNRYFYAKLAPGQQDNKVYIRDGLNGMERLLVKPDTFAGGGKRVSIISISPSPDGKLLAVLVAPGGGDFGDIRVLDVASGKETGDRIEKTSFSAADWMPDGRSFFYFKFQDAPPTEKMQKIRVFRHTLGTKSETDKAVFGYGVNPNIKLETTAIPTLNIARGSKYLIAQVFSGDSVNSVFYIAPKEAMNKDAASIKWRKIVDLEDEVASLELRGDNVYLLTYKNAPRHKIVRFNLKNSDLSKAETILPASDAVVENFTPTNDALYVQTLDGGTQKIYRTGYKTKKAELINLPYQGSARLSTNPFDLDAGIYFDIQSWTQSPTHFLYNPKTKTATDTKLLPPIPVEMSNVEFTNVKAKSHDGVMIPLVIIYKKGLPRDGKNPVLMLGYGSYGTKHTSPSLQIDYLPWLNRGGILVYTGIRGGGEYGKEWHMAGYQKTKPNTWKDFIACAEYLIAEKYTAPQHLGIMGRSAGGLLISNAITERPDLFGAAISAAGLNNALLAETTPNGVPNIPEFGTFKTEEGFKNLLAMDGYYKVKDGVKYPAVMLAHGINDTRVEPWMSAKLAASLQAATASGKPVLLRIDYDAGHIFGSTKMQRNEEKANYFAFLFEQLGAGNR